MSRGSPARGGGPGGALPAARLVRRRAWWGARVARCKAVDGVSFSISRGEVLGVVGESGSGKTTLGRALLRLVDPTAGAVRLEGRDVAAMNERDVRAMRQRDADGVPGPACLAQPGDDARDRGRPPARIHGITRDRTEIRRRVSEVLERVGLAPAEQYLGKFPSDLSGGQKQRAVLARAVILGPRLLVADEPISMLDMSVRAKILELMLGLKHDLDLTYLYITHDLATAKFFCDRVAIMYLGRIVEIGATDEIFANPRHPYTESLLRAIPDPDPSAGVPRNLPRGEVPDAACRRSAAASTPAARVRSRSAAGSRATCTTCSSGAGRRPARSGSRPSVRCWATSPRSTAGRADRDRGRVGAQRRAGGGAARRHPRGAVRGAAVDRGQLDRGRRRLRRGRLPPWQRSRAAAGGWGGGRVPPLRPGGDRGGGAGAGRGGGRLAG